jgi:hypothetical protein
VQAENESQEKIKRFFCATAMRPALLALFRSSGKLLEIFACVQRPFQDTSDRRHP